MTLSQALARLTALSPTVMGQSSSDSLFLSRGHSPYSWSPPQHARTTSAEASILSSKSCVSGIGCSLVDLQTPVPGLGLPTHQDLGVLAGGHRRFRLLRLGLLGLGGCGL